MIHNLQQKIQGRILFIILRAILNNAYVYSNMYTYVFILYMRVFYSFKFLRVCFL